VNTSANIQGSPRILDRHTNACPEMDSAVIHYDNIVAPQHWDGEAFDIGEKHLRSGAFDHHWGNHFVVAQSGHKGDRVHVPPERCQPPGHRTQPVPSVSVRRLLESFESLGFDGARLDSRKVKQRQRRDRFVQVPLWWAEQMTKATETPQAFVGIWLLYLAWKTGKSTFPLPNGQQSSWSQSQGQARRPKQVRGSRTD
jgi:hypothetical protein